MLMMIEKVQRVIIDGIIFIVSVLLRFSSREADLRKRNIVGALLRFLITNIELIIPI